MKKNRILHTIVQGGSENDWDWNWIITGNEADIILNGNHIDTINLDDLIEKWIDDFEASHYVINKLKK